MEEFIDRLLPCPECKEPPQLVRQVGCVYYECGKCPRRENEKRYEAIQINSIKSEEELINEAKKLWNESCLSG